LQEVNGNGKRVRKKPVKYTPPVGEAMEDDISCSSEGATPSSEEEDASPQSVFSSPEGATPSSDDVSVTSTASDDEGVNEEDEEDGEDPPFDLDMGDLGEVDPVALQATGERVEIDLSNDDDSDSGGDVVRNLQDRDVLGPCTQCGKGSVSSVHQCPGSNGSMHGYCGEGVGDEGHGQQRSCTGCTGTAAATPAPAVPVPAPAMPAPGQSPRPKRVRVARSPRPYSHGILHDCPTCVEGGVGCPDCIRTKPLRRKRPRPFTGLLD
jgi:hypothetical protein